MKLKMKTRQFGDRLDEKQFSVDARMRTARGILMSRRILAKIFGFALALALIPVVQSGAQSAQEWKLPDIPWAFPIRDKNPPVIDERSGPIHVLGSDKTYTQDQIDNLQN